LQIQACAPESGSGAGSEFVEGLGRPFGSGVGLETSRTGRAATSATEHDIVDGDEAGTRELVAAILKRGGAGLPGRQVCERVVAMVAPRAAEPLDRRLRTHAGGQEPTRTATNARGRRLYWCLVDPARLPGWAQ
jgi:hypothetical protein